MANCFYCRNLSVTKMRTFGFFDAQTLVIPVFGKTPPYKNTCLVKLPLTKIDVWKKSTLRKYIFGKAQPYENRCWGEVNLTKIDVWKKSILQK